MKRLIQRRIRQGGGLGGAAPAGAPGGGVLAASQGVVSGAGAKRRELDFRQHLATSSSAGSVHVESGPLLEWAAALELTIATNGAEPYKATAQRIIPANDHAATMDSNGWSAVRALPYLDDHAKDQMREAVKKYMAGSG